MIISPTMNGNIIRNDITADLIFINYNTKYLIEQVLELVTITDGKYNVIVVDNASTDGSQEYLKTRKDIKTVLLKENLGYGGGCNAGANVSKSDILVFLNTDLIFTDKNWLNGVKKTLLNPQNAIAGPQLMQANGNQWPIHYEDWVCGACFGVRRDFFDSIGGFDPVYFMYYEETDMCKQAVLRGKNVINCPETVIHLYDKSPKDKAKSSEWFEKSQDIFFKRWNENNRKVGMMIIGNEGEKNEYVAPIEQLGKFCDITVLVLDGITDGTDKAIKKLVDKSNSEFVIYQQEESTFLEKENELREFAFNMCVKENPRWIISLDADELFTKKTMNFLEENLNTENEDLGYMFTCMHFWKSKKKYRTDNKWLDTKIMRVVRYNKGIESKFFEMKQHCGTFPKFYYELKNREHKSIKTMGQFGVKHFSFMTEEIIQKKGEFYKNFPAEPYNDILSDNLILKEYKNEY